MKDHISKRNLGRLYCLLLVSLLLSGGRQSLSDSAFGFFDAGIRGQVLELLEETGIEIG